MWTKIAMILPILLSMFIGASYMPEKTFSQIFDECSSVVLYVDGQMTEINKDNTLNEFNKMLEGSYYSPAFGVSFHNSILQEIKTGYWIEFNFDQEHTFAGMSYSKLLIYLQPEYYGFNIVRYDNNEYTGRCFYLNLNVPSTDFYNYILDNYTPPIN